MYVCDVSFWACRGAKTNEKRTLSPCLLAPEVATKAPADRWGRSEPAEGSGARSRFSLLVEGSLSLPVCLLLGCASARARWWRDDGCETRLLEEGMRKFWRWLAREVGTKETTSAGAGRSAAPPLDRGGWFFGDAGRSRKTKARCETCWRQRRWERSLTQLRVKKRVCAQVLFYEGGGQDKAGASRERGE